MEFVPGIVPKTSGQPAYWFALQGDKLLVAREQDKVSIPRVSDLSTLKIRPRRTQYFGALDGVPCYSAELSDTTIVPEGLDFIGLRQLFGLVEEVLFSLAGRARQTVDWDRTHQYCGQCGSATQNKPDERAKICPKCGLLNYPSMWPAIIVAITKEDEILLARGNRFASPMYSILAGFVEPGETLEDCVRREIKEEVGIEVKNISYFGSQSWPFPNSLMIGFTADYAGGEICIDPGEIVDAGWYRRDNLPLIPERISIARRMIDRFIEGQVK